MMEINFQQRTVAKTKWAVNYYNDWREMRLDKVDYEDKIYEADLNNIEKLTKQNFKFVLYRFICEVKKSKDDKDYPGKTLYQLVCALQNYLKKKKLDWKLVHGNEFTNFNRVLDSVMKEHVAQSIGTVKKQAQVISMEYENSLWLKNVLGEDTPDKLRSKEVMRSNTKIGLSRVMRLELIVH